MQGGIWRVRDKVIVLGEDNHVLFGLYEWDNGGYNICNHVFIQNSISV